jgi:type II secretory pathway component PulF
MDLTMTTNSHTTAGHKSQRVDQVTSLLTALIITTICIIIIIIIVIRPA